MGNEGQKTCGDLPETTAFKSYAAKQERRSQYANYSDLPAVSFLRLTHSEASEGYPTIVNNIQPCPKLCLPMPLAYVGARTDSTSYTATREAWPISAHAHWRSRQDNAVFAPRVWHFSASSCISFTSFSSKELSFSFYFCSVSKKMSTFASSCFF